MLSWVSPFIHLIGLILATILPISVSVYVGRALINPSGHLLDCPFDVVESWCDKP